MNAQRVLVAAVAAGIGTCVFTAQAQDFSDKPIRVLISFAPGGVVDTSPRILTTKMTERLGRTFVVDDRPGGNGLIAVGLAAKAPADGDTRLSAHTDEFAVNPAVFINLPYDPDLELDFTSVTMLSDAAMAVLVGNASGIRSVKELIAQAKAKPVQITCGSPGNGSVNQLAAEWLASAAGIKLPHVPYEAGRRSSPRRTAATS